MKTIPLSKGYEAIVDDELHNELSEYKWHYVSGYARRCDGKKDGKQMFVTMHRQIINAPKGKWVDHINGNSLDNRRCNLRFCNNQQNQHNSKKTEYSTSKYKGVRLKRKKWNAQITHNNLSHYIGSYDTQEEAALAYNKEASKRFGEFANLNVINPMKKQTHFTCLTNEIDMHEPKDHNNLYVGITLGIVFTVCAIVYAFMSQFNSIV